MAIARDDDGADEGAGIGDATRAACGCGRGTDGAARGGAGTSARGGGAVVTGSGAGAGVGGSGDGARAATTAGRSNGIPCDVQNCARFSRLVVTNGSDAGSVAVAIV